MGFLQEIPCLNHRKTQRQPGWLSNKLASWEEGLATLAATVAAAAAVVVVVVVVVAAAVKAKGKEWQLEMSPPPAAAAAAALSCWYWPSAARSSQLSLLSSPQTPSAARSLPPRYPRCRIG